MPQPRLEGRDGQVWAAYVDGRTQEAIATEHGITQQRVSQILAGVREVIPASDRADALLLDLERLDRVLVAFMPIAEGGDVKAAGVVLRVTERRSKLLGLDAVEPMRITFERHLDDEGQLVADALAAALDAVELSEEQRIAALSAAQRQLAGEAPPPGSRPVQGPPAPSGPGTGGSALEVKFRALMKADGIDPDELLREVDEEDDDDE